MASLIAKADIENELQITLPAGYTTGIVSGICDDADAELQGRTNRISFTGLAARRAKRAELLIAIDYLATSNRDLVKVAISSISENGANIIFNNGKTLVSYREEADRIIRDLAIPGTQKFDMTFADPEGSHSSDDMGLFYAP